ncbi:fimbrial protein, partial [Klebsiella michiganensis]|uniref:fimbrial protein n=1 Tax=Klebsiella michiganensis TaxID=1134687 RepID=UPI001D18205E
LLIALINGSFRNHRNFSSGLLVSSARAIELPYNHTGTNFENSGVLSSFSGTVRYNGISYPFPTTSETARMTYSSIVDSPWPTVL